MAKKTRCNVPRLSLTAAGDALPVNPAGSAPIFAALLPKGAAVAELHLPADPIDPALEALLYPRERASVSRAVERRRQEFAAGRLCARRALAEHGITDFELLPGPDRAPLWPASVVGSITHTHGYCAAVVADRGVVAGLGIDTEVAGAVGEELWPRLYSDGESRRLALLPAPARGIAATLLFAAKEAFYKCQYPITGERLDFLDVRIGWEETPLPTGGTLTIEPQRALALFDQPCGRLIARYQIHDPYVSVAVWVQLNTPCRPETP